MGKKKNKTKNQQGDSKSQSPKLEESRPGTSEDKSSAEQTEECLTPVESEVKEEPFQIAQRKKKVSQENQSDEPQKTSQQLSNSSQSSAVQSQTNFEQAVERHKDSSHTLRVTSEQSFGDREVDNDLKTMQQQHTSFTSRPKSPQSQTHTRPQPAQPPASLHVGDSVRPSSDTKTNANFPDFPPLKAGRGRGRGRGRGTPTVGKPISAPAEGNLESTAMRGIQDTSKRVPSAWGARRTATVEVESSVVRSSSEMVPTRPEPSASPEIPILESTVSGDTATPRSIAEQRPPDQTQLEPNVMASGDVAPSAVAVVTTPNDTAVSLSQIPNVIPRAGFQIPTRTNHTKAGSKGRHTTVRTNHLSLNIQCLATKTAVHYDVAVDPDKPKRLLRRALEEFRAKHFPTRFPAFDGRRNLYAATPLPFNHKIEFRDTIKVMDSERQKEKEFKIVLKYATRVDLTSLTTYMRSGTSLEAPQQAIQVLDIVLRCAPALWFVPVGRSYFTPPSGTVEPLGDGYEMWYGLFQSVNLGWQPFVNVDVVHKGFPQAQSLINAIQDVCVDSSNPVDLHRGLSDNHLYKLKKFLVGLKIDYVLPNNPSSKRTYKVNNVVLPPPQLQFDLDSGENITVEEYYKREKKVQLRFKNLPCLHVGSLKRPVPIYLPLEFCSVTGGQVTQKKLSDRQTASMIRKAATSTMDRERKIKDALIRARFSTSPQVQEFGFRVTENFEEIRARVLDPPKLEYRNKEGLLPQRGVWQPKPFLNGRRLDKWTILVLDDRVQTDVIGKFINQFISQGNKLGMIISEPFPARRMDSRKMRTELEPYFRDCFKDSCELVVIVVSEKGTEYAFIKQIAELTVGVLTQCVKSSTMLRRMDYATAQNILLKVNSKLNGINHTLHDISRPKIFQKPIMIVGADVTHPSPDETKIPSVAAVCASHDPKAFQYNTQFRLQPPRMEIIQDLESIMRQHLLYFYHKTGQMKPLRILFYRDGVSEGQFQQVLDSELTAIRSACSKLEREYKPAITFMVVQKRHHTRLFPTKKEDSDGKNCNVVPGTIVDSTITHPTERDFYLVSHTSIQGVIRPTKYHCLWDDNRLTEDELEEVTYFLCHLFSRCTRSVSYPAPTYYAHLAAYRARVYLSGQNLENLSDERLHTQLLGDLQKRSPMYFI